MQYFGFSQYLFLRQSQKDQFMSARAASASTSPKNPPKPRTPARIADTRYEIKRELRKERCDHCHELESGNAAGAFWHRQNTPTAGEDCNGLWPLVVKNLWLQWPVAAGCGEHVAAIACGRVLWQSILFFTAVPEGPIHERTRSQRLYRSSQSTQTKNPV